VEQDHADRVSCIRLAEARESHARGTKTEIVLELLRHARELVEIIEEEINHERERLADPDVVRMAAAGLRKRVEVAAAKLVLLHSEDQEKAAAPS
jgi:hypothetical protein